MSRPNVRGLGDRADGSSPRDARQQSRTVVVVTTGGTIASRPDTSGGVVAAESPEELLAAVPQLRRIAEIRAEEIFRIGSYLLKPADMLHLARRVRSLAGDASVDGVVVTHGTDTMEESAYLVDLIYDGEKPVVFTGAQRNASVSDTDGSRNLADAVRVAADPAAHNLGMVVALGGRIDAARTATKVHTTALVAFGSPGRGPVGEVTEGGAVRIFHRPTRSNSLAGMPSSLPRVDLIKLYAGLDGSFVRAACEAEACGIVLEAFGNGNANHEVLEEVERSIDSDVEVMVVSRCSEGSVKPVYGNGGGHDLKETGAIFAGDLSGQKGRLLLMVALAKRKERGKSVQELMQQHLII